MKRLFVWMFLSVIGALWAVAGFASETTSSSGGGSTAEPTKTDGMQALTINVPDPKTGVPLTFTFISIMNTSAASSTVTVSFIDGGSLSSRSGDASQAPAPQK